MTRQAQKANYYARVFNMPETEAELIRTLGKRLDKTRIQVFREMMPFLEDFEPPPRGERVSLTLHFPLGFYELLEKCATKGNRTIQDTLILLVEEYLEKLKA